MRRRTLNDMSETGDTARERGGFAPLVGAALAALTVGSLLLFSVVAQRASVGGFPTGRAVVTTPSATTSQAITITPDRRDGTVGDAAPEAIPATNPTELITVAPLPPAPVEAAADGVGDAEGVEVAQAERSSGSAPDDTEGPLFSFGGAGRKGEEVWKGDVYTKAEGKDKAEKRKDKAEKRKDKAEKRRESHGRSEDERHASHSQAGHGPSNNAHKSDDRGRPEGSGPPAHASGGGPKNVPPGHAKAKGEGHSKGRGRGHGHD